MNYVPQVILCIRYICKHLTSVHSSSFMFSVFGFSLVAHLGYILLRWWLSVDPNKNKKINISTRINSRLNCAKYKLSSVYYCSRSNCITEWLHNYTLFIIKHWKFSRFIRLTFFYSDVLWNIWFYEIFDNTYCFRSWAIITTEALKWQLWRYYTIAM